jgi:hypothetical protein
MNYAMYSRLLLPFFKGKGNRRAGEADSVKWVICEDTNHGIIIIIDVFVLLFVLHIFSFSNLSNRDTYTHKHIFI